MNETVLSNIWDKTKLVRAWFYMVSPNESTPSDEMAAEYKVMDFVEYSVPLFIFCVLLEFLFSPLTKTRIRLNDSLTSLTAGSYSRILHLFGFNAAYVVYHYSYEHRLFTLPYHATAHWVIAAFVADFSYYWAHRAVHELNIGWSGHQVHHSSEDYNISTALRQSIMQVWYTTWLSIPAALLGVHPSMYFTHHSLNLTWQFWIHTETIRYMGSTFEFIFNTPSHHRVHHGRNPFCIDKNYAGVLIIWDRMFGTFASEFDHEEPVKYGLVNNVRSFDQNYVQFGYLKYVLNKALNTPGILPKIRVLVMGPGYVESEPEYRLGNPKDLPEIDPDYEIFDPPVSTGMKLYAFLVGVHSNLLYEYIHAVKGSFGTYEKCIVVAYFVYCGSAAGNLFNNSRLGSFMEIIRYFVIIPYLMINNSLGSFFVDNFNICLVLSLSIGIFFCKKYFSPSSNPKQKLH